MIITLLLPRYTKLSPTNSLPRHFVYFAGNYCIQSNRKEARFIMSWRYLKGITQLVLHRYGSKDSFVCLSEKRFFFYQKKRKLALWCDLMMRWLNKWISSHRVDPWLMPCFFFKSFQVRGVKIIVKTKEQSQSEGVKGDCHSSISERNKTATNLL